jgi:rare lipoprotein A
MIRFRTALILTILLLTVFSLGTAQAGDGKDVPTVRIDTVLSSRTGTASYYAAKFQGRHTSNGELLDNDAYTCASYLPYNTWIRVTHLCNGKSVVVRVTDRFRPGGKHLVDLTLRAAKEIDMVRFGVARIRMEILNPDIIRADLPKDSVSLPLPIPGKIVEVSIQKPDIQIDRIIR